MFPGNIFSPGYPDSHKSKRLNRKVIPKNVTNYTISSHDFGRILEFRAVTNITVNLPDPRTCENCWFTVILYPPTYGTNQVSYTIPGAGGIDGNNVGNSSCANYSSQTLFSDGLFWRLLNVSLLHPIWLFVNSAMQVTHQLTTECTSLATGAWRFLGGLAVTKNLFLGQKINQAAYNNASPANGDMWIDNTSTTYAAYTKGLKTFVRTTIQVENTNAGPAASSAETSLLDSAITLPANWWKAKHQIVIELFGSHADNSAAAPAVRVTLGGTSVWDSGNISGSGSGVWNARIVLTCTATGASGSIRSNGVLSYGINAGSMSQPAVGNTTINTTGSLALDVTARDTPATTAITFTKTSGFIDTVTSV